ncbi:MAG: DUF3990 domain-containing protein [Lachnospiraceae bacterium]|nr:DUF3990 domain-containing protein [Lachnospiraceae bacterium]
MILYHGSSRIIMKPVWHGGRKHNDYGYGFYCTEFPDLAREWSVSPDSMGFLNEYEADVEGLSVLDLNDHGILTWLAVLLNNRTFKLDSPLSREAARYLMDEFLIDCEDYDVIRGYRADDSYFSFAQDFINGTISVEQLKKAMRLGDLGNQIVMNSVRAHENLIFKGYEEVDNTVWYPKRANRDRKARQSYFDMDRFGYRKGDIYITKILDEEMKRDDIRLR